MLYVFFVAGATKLNPAISTTEREVELAARKWLTNCRDRDGMRGARGRGEANNAAE